MQPVSFHNIGEMLENQQMYADMYFGTVHAGGQTAAIFTTQDHLLGLGLSREVLIHGTFSVKISKI